MPSLPDPFPPGRRHLGARPAVAVVAVITVLAVAACAPRGADGPPPGQGDAPAPERDGFAAQPVALLFTDYDRDRDRRITADEFEQGVQASFAEADTDHNGRISPLEFVSWAKAALGTEAGPPSRFAFTPYPESAISAAVFHDALRREFDRLDSDKNGVLTRAELAVPAQRTGTDRAGSGRPAGGPPQGGGMRRP